MKAFHYLGSLLVVCRMNKNMELRELSAGELFELDVEITVSLSDIYADVER